MNNLESYVNNLRGIPEVEFKNLMNSNSELTRDEKCYLYYYLFPRPLLDKELPSRVFAARGNKYTGALPLHPETKEICMLIEACNTMQYSRFMKHVFHAFTDNEDKLFPMAGKETRECPICGKKIFEIDTWTYFCDKYPEQNEQNNRQYLAFGSTDSRLSLCLDCLVQLNFARKVIDCLDPSFLDWRKKQSKSTKLSWEDLKL